MTKRDKKDPSVTNSLQPTRRDRFLPAELLGISIGLGVFVGLIVLIATREFILAAVALGVAFIVSLVFMALFALAFKPTEAEVEDIHEQDVEAQEKAAERAGDTALRTDGGDANDGDANDGDANHGGANDGDANHGGAPDEGRPTFH